MGRPRTERGGINGVGREPRRTRRHRTHETRNISRTWREPEHHRQELQCRSRHDLKTRTRVKISRSTEEGAYVDQSSAFESPQSELRGNGDENSARRG